MSNQIEQLIANIEQKFDDQFHLVSKEESAEQNKFVPSNKDDHSEDFHNFSGSNPQNESYQRSKNDMKQAIFIEENQENDEQNEQEDPVDNQNDNKLPYREEQVSFEEMDICDDDNKYKQLSSKLESALKKISSSKQQFSTFQSTKGASFLHRFEDYQRKKQKDLQLKRRIQEERKFVGLKTKPQINPKSRQMAEQSSYRPIYERFNQIVQQKKKKLEVNQELKKQKQDEQFEKLAQTMSKRTKTEQSRDTQTFFTDMIHWKEKLEKDKEQKAKQRQEKQKQGLTFKPQINKKSAQLIKSQKRVPIQDREIEKAKVEVPQFSFHPKINKKKIK